MSCRRWKQIFDQNGLPSDQHLVIPMQVLYEETI